ncbi:MAG: 4-alpha-glucanotransferase [Lachnospiraceae bacterium]|nr:4-alpha-glucanotransferase [Lachnospiraceae bacterium]
MRRSGILLPISSIPSKYGIGSFSKEAYEFVDFLVEAGQKLWQILPLGPTGYGDSPYQSFSTFAGNPYFIDLDEFVELGYITREDCERLNFGTNPEYVDYGQLYNNRYLLLEKAYDSALEDGLEADGEYQAFIKENKYWLTDYALYRTVKRAFDNACWTEWDEDIRLRQPQAIKRYSKEYAYEMGFYYFMQYFFAKQWKALKTYANEKGIEIVGDIPIYVAFDSADSWANPELFQLDEENLPIGVAGCPPDAFSETGQLWGNPLYDWQYHKETKFAWWLKRLAHCYELYDVVRIDHFRGFDEYWFVPYGDETAQNGHWEAGPGIELFKAMKRKFGKLQVIAEDLGFLTPSVLQLLEDTGFPGMKVLQFAFGSDAKNLYLPHNHRQNSVVYTGTHDNETTIGWYQNLNDWTREHVNKYLGITDGKDINWRFIQVALSSVADTVVIPMQDYLGLGNEARINMPSSFGKNWEWRMKKGASTKDLAEKIKEMTIIYGRL